MNISGNSQRPVQNQRRAGIASVAFRICMLLLAIACPLQVWAQGVTTAVAPPTFWTCTPPPTMPAGTPASAPAWLTDQTVECGENRISGMWIQAQHTGPGGGVPAGMV